MGQVASNTADSGIAKKVGNAGDYKSGLGGWLTGVAGLRSLLGMDKQDLANREYEEGQARFNKYSGLLEGLIPKYEEQYAKYLGGTEDLLANNPNLDLSKFSNQLGGFSDQLSKGSRQLDSIRSDTEQGIKKYMSQGDERISSMLKESFSGADNYLKEAKGLASSDMPGLSIYQDQQGSNMANSIQQLKSLGGANSSSVAGVLAGNQNASANLALESARYKTQARQNLASSFLTAGQVKAGSLGQAASFAQNQAGLNQNLGQFSSGIVGQQANILGQQASITGQQSNIAQNEFLNNELNPWLQNLQWNQSQTNANNPLAYQSQVYGTLSGMGWSQQQGGSAQQQQNAADQQQNTMGVLGMIAKLFV